MKNIPVWIKSSLTVSEAKINIMQLSVTCFPCYLFSFLNPSRSHFISFHYFSTEWYMYNNF